MECCMEVGITDYQYVAAFRSYHRRCPLGQSNPLSQLVVG